MNPSNRFPTSCDFISTDRLLNFPFFSFRFVKYATIDGSVDNRGIVWLKQLMPSRAILNDFPYSNSEILDKTDEKTAQTRIVEVYMINI